MKREQQRRGHHRGPRAARDPRQQHPRRQPCLDCESLTSVTGSCKDGGQPSTGNHARERKARTDLVVDATRLVRDLLPKHRKLDRATEQAITRAASVVALLDSLAVVDDE